MSLNIQCPIQLAIFTNNLCKTFNLSPYLLGIFDIQSMVRFIHDTLFKDAGDHIIHLNNLILEV